MGGRNPVDAVYKVIVDSDIRWSGALARHRQQGSIQVPVGDAASLVGNQTQPIDNVLLTPRETSPPVAILLTNHMAPTREGQPPGSKSHVVIMIGILVHVNVTEYSKLEAWTRRIAVLISVGTAARLSCSMGSGRLLRVTH